MVEAQEKTAIDKGMKTLWLIWAAMLGNLLIFIFVCRQLGEGFRGTGGSDVPVGLLRSIFFVLAAAELIMSYYLRRFWLKTRPEAARAAMGRRTAILNRPFFVVQYTTVVVISLALAESIGIYGLVLFLLGGGFKTLYIFIAVSALAMVFYRPKREEMERLAMAYKKQAGTSPEI
jgi:hypothetical protein